MPAAGIKSLDSAGRRGGREVEFDEPHRLCYKRTNEHGRHTTKSDSGRLRSPGCEALGEACRPCAQGLAVAGSEREGKRARTAAV